MSKIRTVKLGKCMYYEGNEPLEAGLPAGLHAEGMQAGNNIATNCIRKFKEALGYGQY